ncbi:hypothetical protein LTR12_016209 [Friedmanniomyces endolithicus]|nr:hypothetical protein LTR12_016209 [Friedmanniomyces endolithicus]
MRLLNVHDLSFRVFLGEGTPRYVTASHRWGEETETTIKDVQKRRNPDKIGYRKMEGFAQYVREHIPHVDWLWIDTCCINQESDREVSEAVNSMFRWYHNAVVCLAYLADVTPSEVVGDVKCMDVFRHSVWFKRGWTLQELLAPSAVVFLTERWEVLGHKGEYDNEKSSPPLHMGPSLDSTIAAITRIPEAALKSDDRSTKFSVRERFAWMEGKESARKRLMEAIRRDTSGNGDESPPPTISGSGELLAAPMRTAASSGDVQTVRRMLEAGVDVNRVAEDGGTALQIAAFRGQEAVVDLLLQWKADPNLSTPLMSAVGSGVSPKIAAKLIQAGAVATPEALWRAASRGDTAAAKTLLEAGVDVNSVAEDGGAALSCAVQHGHADIVRLLIERGAH